MFKHLSLFAAGLALGVVCGGGESRTGGGEKAARAMDRGSARQEKKWTRDDAQALIEREREQGAGFVALDDELATWSAEEIRAALGELLAGPDCLAEYGPIADLKVMLVTAAMKRDLPGFLDWFGALKSDIGRRQLSGTIVAAWPAEKVEEGFAYAMANPGFFTTENHGVPLALFKNALLSSAVRGPDAVAEKLAIAEAHGLQLPEWPLGKGEPKFPEGFDFATLATTPELSRLWEHGRAEFILADWLRQKPDEAFDAILARDRESGSPPGDYLAPFKESGAPSDEQVQWLAGKLDGLTAEERQRVIAESLTVMSWRPEGLASFSEALTEPADREQVKDYAVQAIRGIGVAAALPFLETMTDPAERIAVLESGPLTGSDRGYSQEEKDEDIALLRTKLSEWQASPAQIETIVSRIHPSEP